MLGWEFDYPHLSTTYLPTSICSSKQTQWADPIRRRTNLPHPTHLSLQKYKRVRTGCTRNASVITASNSEPTLTFSCYISLPCTENHQRLLDWYDRWMGQIRFFVFTWWVEIWDEMRWDEMKGERLPGTFVPRFKMFGIKIRCEWVLACGFEMTSFFLLDRVLCDVQSWNLLMKKL